MSLAVSLNRRKDSEAGWLFRPSDFQRSSRSILRTLGIDHSLVGAGGVVFPPPTATWNDLNEPKNSYPRSNPHHLHDGGFNVGHDVAIDHGFTMEWLLAWPWQALTAWPIAFVFTQFTTPLAFAIANRTIAK